LDNESDYFDYKIYCLQNAINEFILNEINEIISILKFNPNILKLYIEEEIINQASVNEHINSVFKITKLSRTPAYGVKRIFINNDLVNFSLKPCQVFMFLLSKPFADRFLQNIIKNTKLISFLKILNYTENFYKDNYMHLIDNFYTLNSENILNEEVKVNSDINLVKLVQINTFSYDLLFSKYFDIEIFDFSGIFETYDNEIKRLGFEFQYIIERRNNFELYIVYLIQNEIKQKREQLKPSLDIIENINKLTLSKITQNSNKFIKMLFSDKDYKNDYIDISEIIEQFERISNIENLNENILKIKEAQLKILEVIFK
jgi:hypothetical protein